MKKYFLILTFILTSTLLFVASADARGARSTYGGTPVAGGIQYCFPGGCFISNRAGNYSVHGSTYQEIYQNHLSYITMHSPGIYNENYTGTISAYYSGTFVNGVLMTFSCYNGFAVDFRQAPCTNGANNPPSCNTCSTGSTLTNGQCVCNNGAPNSPLCNLCPSGLIMENNICICANGANDPTACNTCPAGSTMINGKCACANGATASSNCTQCPAYMVMHNSQCVDGCELTNVCGQQVQGIMVGGKCAAADGTNPNSSCITTFDVTSDRVNPNGSVEFTWSIANLQPNVKQTCGFYDYTTPTPRPIPGLQNLDTTQEKARISNIQTTTRFCLVCNFYNATTNASLGDAVQHQWIRVIRIGEN